MDKRLDFFFNRGMAIPLLLPKLEIPAILDALEAHLVVAPEEIELWNSLVCEHHFECMLNASQKSCGGAS